MSPPRPEWGPVVSKLFGWRLPTSGSAWAERIVQQAHGQGEDLAALSRAAARGEVEAAARLAELGSVDETFFFRDPEALEAGLKRCPPAAGTRVRIWSAGCASGEEAYTLALLAESILGGRPFRVLGTDVAAGRLKKAERGLYADWSFRGPHAKRARTHLQREREGLSIPARVRAHVHFAQHNLLDGVPGNEGPFDLVVCRNVLIYFAPDKAAEVLNTFRQAVRPGGILVTGVMEYHGPHLGLQQEPECPLGVFRRADNRAPQAVTLPVPSPVPIAPVSPSVDLQQEAGEAYVRGMALLDNGELSQALSCFQAAVARVEAQPLAWLGQAFAWLQLGETSEARKSAERVLALTEKVPEWSLVDGGGDKMSAGQVRALATQILEMG